MGNLVQNAKPLLSSVLKFFAKIPGGVWVIVGILLILFIFGIIIYVIRNKNKEYEYDKYKTDENTNDGLNLYSTKEYAKIMNNL